jgi:hypothetical protein
MGVNAQTAVPAFTTGQVLTAAQMTQVNTGIPVFADTTARDAAFGGAGEKVLAEGQFAYIEATDTTQYYSGSSWIAVGASGLTFIAASGAQSAVANIAFNNCFSATYSNYKIVIDNLVQSVGANSQMRLRVSGSDNSSANYYTQRYEVISASIGGVSITGATYWSPSYVANSTDGASISIDIYRPFATAATIANFQAARTDSTSSLYGVGGSLYMSSATSFDGFNIVPASGTVSCTNIRVYGYSNS